ncbi:SMI1/KNR4 family protein [Streptomyces sp. NBC_00690]|uniref:SMI1/KNR4 family protein n=1 Tax=Streptomyces sp. NBC_00690 TaxID=2975808 RepID=UPI002E2880D8|nr:SMI1/KNR4 family protein [Streptomyces sp. NBC_00690]
MDSSTPDGPYNLQELWLRFENWLCQNAPADHATLRPGVSDAEIVRLEEEIGFALVDELKSFLAIHNGVASRRSSMEPGAFIIGYSLLNAEGIMEWQHNLADMAQEAFDEGYENDVVELTANSRWVPFAQSLAGDLLFVDHRTDRYGHVGVISFGSPEYRRLWPSMGQMFYDLCNAVEALEQLPTMPRRPCIHEGRMLEWVID